MAASALALLPGLPRVACNNDKEAMRFLRSTAGCYAKSNDLLQYVNEVIQDEHGRGEEEGSTPAAPVRLMTVHQAKGLEADAVHVVGLQDGEFPMKRGEMNEEVRILYVALTRPRHYLGWTHSPHAKPSRLLPLELLPRTARMRPDMMDGGAHGVQQATI